MAIVISPLRCTNRAEEFLDSPAQRHALPRKLARRIEDLVDEAAGIRDRHADIRDILRHLDGAPGGFLDVPGNDSGGHHLLADRIPHGLGQGVHLGQGCRDRPDRIDRAEFKALDTRLPSIAKLALEENTRQNRDPDYRWLVEDISALNRLRDQRALSLSLEKRRAERAQLEANRLARENARRVARAESPLASIEDLDVSKQPDVVLDQSAEVMVDMLKLSAPTKTPKPKAVTAKREAA